MRKIIFTHGKDIKIINCERGNRSCSPTEEISTVTEIKDIPT